MKGNVTCSQFLINPEEQSVMQTKPQNVSLPHFPRAVCLLSASRKTNTALDHEREVMQIGHPTGKDG